MSRPLGEIVTIGDNPTSIFKDIPPIQQQRILWIRSFFPELDGVTIQFRRMSDSPYAGKADWTRNIVRLTEDACLYNVVIAHELTHIASGHNNGIPKGEKACDLWTLARSPVLNDYPPGYLDLPIAIKKGWNRGHARALSDLARAAIMFRELKEERHYIRWFEETVKIAEGLGRKNEITAISTPKGLIA